MTNEMKMSTQKFATPISKIVDDDYGIPWGTGSYIELYGRPHLLTNEHVTRALNTHALGHQFLGDDTVHRATGPFHAETWPFDVAVGAIDDKVWSCQQHSSEPIPEDKWALAHVPVPREILCVKGFAGAEANFLFGTLV